MSAEHLSWWSDLRHGGLLLDIPRLSDVVPAMPPPLGDVRQDRLRREILAFQDDPTEKRGRLVTYVLHDLCGFTSPPGEWKRGTNVPAEWTRRGLMGEAIRPQHLWLGPYGAVLPVFIDDQKRLGLGRSARVASNALQWLRQGNEQLAVVTNGQQWRLLFAGLDYEAWCEWDIAQWFLEGQVSPVFDGLRALISPPLWTPPETGKSCRLVQAVNESRKGQADLSQVLGERVRRAAELLIEGHARVLNDHRGELDPQEIYRAAVRMIMRLVVVLFAESRDGLLPRDNPIYHGSYSLQGLRDLLERTSLHKRVAGFAAYPRVLALRKLIHEGCSHEAMLVPTYNGELFAPGDPASTDGMKRALYLFENACFEHELMNDQQVRDILDLLTRTQVRIRQGRSSTSISAPVDFSSLDSEYIGILYEGLLDFELRSAAENQPIIFLAVGNQPALPLATLEGMNDAAIKNLLEKMKDTSTDDEDDDAGEDDTGDEESIEDESNDEPVEDELQPESEPADSDAPVAAAPRGGRAAAQPPSSTDATAQSGPSSANPVATGGDRYDDPRYTLRARAEEWARRACERGGLVKKPRGNLTPEKRMQYEAAVASTARQLITKVVLPGEWYLVRWGGTRKGSGTFYTRPQLAIPTTHRTLRPLAYDPPVGPDGQPDLDAPTEKWTPKPPEAIFALKVCDLACGSGSFCLAALRFLTNALYESLLVHQRVREHGGRAVLDLICDANGDRRLVDESLPCRPGDDDFEPRTKAILRRYVVERCIHGVDLDPLAVELCRLSLWIETLDRRLPMTYLNHKIRCGNSLVGAWFDQFLHYPAMAWDREGGDKNHTNGVHFEKEAWTKAIKARSKTVKTDLIDYIDGGRLIYPVDLTTVSTGHDTAEAALREIHDLGITQVAERQAKFEALQNSPDFLRLRNAFDLWCAIWFWPADELDKCPLPTEFAKGDLPAGAAEIARNVARKRRFFHWELEFPDVFNASRAGFDAMLGNPPWEIAKPNSKEFFSAFDPLYRSYGKQEAIDKQREYFGRDADIERQWLDHTSALKGMSNWVKYAGFPYGDRVTYNAERKPQHDFPIGDRGRRSFESSQHRHDRWKLTREESSGYADADHSFRHQGSADINLYKLFLEQAHALLRDGGRLGLLVPSGLYSDHGTGDLRTLLLDQCRWEWLFGFENREGIFDIHRSFKFNPVIAQKGGQTEAIRTAFMRRQLADWERGEQFATLYPRDRVLQFSPRSKALLEIQSPRDLEVLTKIYANSVLLGDQGPDGWGITYAREFDMTNDSKLFPPRPKWEEWGYRPDEYSRWIQGPWRPIEELWTQLGVDLSRPLPIDAECAARIEAGVAAGEVARTAARLRCAQPPYDTLPIPRADIPAGLILSRDATHFIHEDDIPITTFTDAAGRPLKIMIENEDGEEEEIGLRGPAIALPLYEGRMIGQFDFSEKGWVKGKGRSAEWREIPWADKQIEPQYVMGAATYTSIRDKNGLPKAARGLKLGFMAVGSATNSRSMIAGFINDCPCGNAVPPLTPRVPVVAPYLGSILSSFAFDFVMRCRLAGLNLNYFVIAETPLCPPSSLSSHAVHLVSSATVSSRHFAETWLRLSGGTSVEHRAWKQGWALTEEERARVLAACNALSLSMLGYGEQEAAHVLRDCDLPDTRSDEVSRNLDAKGFWRIDKEKHPEHRHTVLTLVAFADLQEKIAACGGDVQRGIEAFCNQNDGQGWMLPEALRLSDYGLGHDDRAGEPQPVRACFGPRFYDWQLAQTPQESWRECHLHARNLLGEAGYAALLQELENQTETDGARSASEGSPGESAARPAEAPGTARPPQGADRPTRPPPGAAATAPQPARPPRQGMLFDTADTPLFDGDKRGQSEQGKSKRSRS